MEGNSELENRNETQSLEGNFLQRVEKGFNLAFRDVLQNDKLQVYVEPFFSHHNIPGDLEGLKERIRESDLYIPEAFGWTTSHLELLRNASSGEINPEELTGRLKRYPPSFRKITEDVYNSHKAIAIVDIPARHRLERESGKVWVYNPSHEGDFSQVLDYTRIFLDNLANYHNQREDYILQQITP